MGASVLWAEEIREEDGRISWITSGHHWNLISKVEKSGYCFAQESGCHWPTFRPPVSRNAEWHLFRRNWKMCPGHHETSYTALQWRRVCMPFWPAKKKKASVDHPLQAGDVADFQHRSVSPQRYLILRQQWKPTDVTMPLGLPVATEMITCPLNCQLSGSATQIVSTKFQEASSKWPSATCGYLGCWFQWLKLYPAIRKAEISAQWLFKSRQISKDVPANALKNWRSFTNHVIWDQNSMYSKQDKWFINIYHYFGRNLLLSLYRLLYDTHGCIFEMAKTQADAAPA